MFSSFVRICSLLYLSIQVLSVVLLRQHRVRYVDFVVALSASASSRSYLPRYRVCSLSSLRSLHSLSSSISMRSLASVPFVPFLCVLLRNCTFVVCFVMTRMRLSKSRGCVFRLAPIEFVCGWMVPDRTSHLYFFATDSGCEIRNLSSHRVISYTCRARS